MMRTVLLPVFPGLVLGGCVQVYHEPKPDISTLHVNLPHAEQGDPLAQYKVGTSFGHNWPGNVVQDDETSLRYLLAAAEQGNTEAQVAVANMYMQHRADSTPQLMDARATGKYWLMRAAHSGSKSAYRALANWNTARYQPPMGPVEVCQWQLLAWNKCLDKTLTPQQIEDAAADADSWKRRLGQP